MLKVKIVAVVVCLIASSGRSWAGQAVPSREVTGRIVTTGGLPVAGASIEARSAESAGDASDDRLVHTDANGRFRWSVDGPGEYDARITANGYRPVTSRSVTGSFGTIVLMRRTELGVSFDRIALDRLPTAREPWSLMTLTPNVTMGDGVNVGGAESGQQLAPSSRASTGITSTVWRLDGEPMTDFYVLGASAGYYNFNAFDAVVVQTGGFDASVQTAGPIISLIPRSGRDRLSGRTYGWFSNRSIQSSNITPDLFADGSGAGVPLQDYREFGADAGGPLIPRRAWWWSAYNRTNITRSTLRFFKQTPECSPPPDSFDALEAISDCLYPDRTTLDNFDAAIDARPLTTQSLHLSFGLDGKFRNVRDASDLIAPESAYRQHGVSPRYVVRHTWTASDRALIETTATYRKSHFTLDFTSPELADTQVFVDVETSRRSRSALFVTDNLRPSATIASTAAVRLGAGHTLKLGVGYRRDDSSLRVTTGGQAIARYYGDGPYNATIYRDSLEFVRDETVHAFIQDHATWSRLSLTLGARLEHHDDSAPPSSVPASKLLPDFLIGATFAGADPTVDFTDIGPRAALSLDVFGTGRTVASAAYGAYFGQSNGRLASAESLTGPVAYMTFRWDDINHDRVFQPNERVGLPFSVAPQYNLSTGIFAPPPPDRLPPTLRNDRSREWMARVDHAINNGWTASATFIARTYDRYRTEVRKGDSASKYVARSITDPVSGLTSTYYEHATYIGPTETITINADGRTTDYRAVEFTSSARFGRRATLRGSFVRQSSTAHWPVGSYNDPTDIANLDGYPADETLPRYILRLTGTIDLPYGIGVGLVASSRDGQIRDVVFDGPLSRLDITGSVTQLMAGPRGSTRYPTVNMLDLQIDKTCRLQSRATLRLTVVIFNALNVGTVLSRDSNLSRPNYDRITGLVGPRVLRFGATFTF